MPDEPHWACLLLTPEEEQARLAQMYFFDPETGDVLGEKPTFSQTALQLGIDMFPEVGRYDYANELYEVLCAERAFELGR